jgi:hypothetical protein
MRCKALEHMIHLNHEATGGAYRTASTIVCGSPAQASHGLPLFAGWSYEEVAKRFACTSFQ